MIKIKNPKEAVVASTIVLFYAVFSMLYLTMVDPKCYIRNLFRNDIIFVVPLIYLLLVILFIYSYGRLMRVNIGRIAYPASAIAMILPMLYLLTDLKTGMLKTNPFGGNRGVYGIYAVAYYTACMSFASVAFGIMFRRLADRSMRLLSCEDPVFHNIIFHLPIFLCFCFVEVILFASGQILYAVSFLCLFLISLCFEKVAIGVAGIRGWIARFLNNEVSFLIAIFVIAFLIRWMWGIRLLAITGENFIRASDDGVTYDPFAALLAQGGMVPKDQVFYWSGYAYWHFLALIYRIFGLHNFKAAIVIQSILGATVPILTYLMTKEIFNSKPIAVISGIMVMLNLTLISLSAVIGMEALYIPVFVATLFITATFLLSKDFNYKHAFIIGASLGLTNIVRSEVLFFPIVISFLLLIFMKRDKGLLNIIFIITALFVGFALFTSIQHIANFMQYGKYKLTSGALAVTYAGDWCTNENSTLSSMGFNPFKSIPESLSTLLHSPAVVLWLLVKGFFKRLIIYFCKPNFGVFDPTYVVNPSSGWFFRFPVWVQLYEYIFIFTGLAYIFIRKKALIVNTLLLVFSIYLSVMYAFVWVSNSRHRAVLIPIFIIFFSYGLYAFCKEVKNSYSIR